MQNKELIGQQDSERIKISDMKDVGIESRNEIPKEVDGYMKKVEENNEQNNIVKQVFEQGSNKTQKSEEISTKIPYSKSVYESGFKKKVSEAGRWLSEFFSRLIKIKKGKVEFTENDN